MKRLYTLLFIRDGSRILLGYKKRGFGKGRWNGFGGKVEPCETIEDAAVRELQEESSLCVGKCDLQKAAILNFEFKDMPELIMEVHVFVSKKFEGEIKESEEMKPKWFEIDSIPFPEMWPDDESWFPLLLRGQQFVGEFVFQNENIMLSQNIVPVNCLS